MAVKPKIEFQETAVSATDFLHELNDPNLLRNCTVPPRVAVELRKQQVHRLRENISVLTAKRDEFIRKMENYIENLRALIRSIERNLEVEIQSESDHDAQVDSQTTLVRCMSCDAQALFKELRIIFARESEESLSRPTEVYVLDGSALKKGFFCCRSCGAENLVIRTV